MGWETQKEDKVAKSSKIINQLKIAFWVRLKLSLRVIHMYFSLYMGKFHKSNLGKLDKEGWDLSYGFKMDR